MRGAAERLAASVVLLAGLGGPALAGEACDGAIEASPLQTLPTPVVITFSSPRDDARAKPVVASFEDGLRAGGVAVQPDAADELRLSFLISTEDGGQLHEYSDFSWTAAPGAADGPPPTLTVTAGLTAKGQPTPLWVASLQCKIKTRDPVVLAQEIGQVIGEVLGKQLDQKSF
jgi:hypothetical protein